MKLSKRTLRFTRLRIVVSVLAGVLILIGGYVFWSVQTWNSYEASYVAWRQDIGHDIESVLSLPDATSDERSKKMLELNAITSSINNQTVCDVSGAVKWQQAIGGLQSKMRACDEAVSLVTDYGAKLSRVVTYLEAEQKIADIIRSTASNKKQTEAIWDAQVAGWSKAVADIGSVEASGDFTATKEAAVQYAKKMESTWKSLVAAHKAKNRANYLKAYADIVSAHETLATLASDSQTRLKAIIKDLQTSYDKLK